MRNVFVQKLFAIIIVFSFAIPASIFISPKPVQASGATVVVADVSWTSIMSTFANIATKAKTALIAANSVLSTAAEYALWLDTYVLKPLVFAESGNLLKSVTAGIIKFINGKNGKGVAMFVTSLSNFKRGTRDNQALRFANKFGNQSNSPFADSIRKSLLSNYAQNSSMDGFLKTLSCSLGKNTPAFVGGNFGKGGWSTWLSLTTKCENDPYCLVYKAQSKMSNTVADATASALNKLSWGNGFLSWCGKTSDSVKKDSAKKQTVSVKYKTSQKSIGGNYKYNSKIGNSAGDPCTNKDGTPGTIKTPGSVIKDQLHKILGTNVDKWAMTGEINKMLGSISTIMKTVQLSKEVIAGANGAGGLLGLSSPSSNGSSWVDQYANSSGYFGQTTNKVLQASVASNSSVTDLFKKNISKYSSYWNTILSNANTASTTLNKLISLNFALPTSTSTNSSILPSSGLYNTGYLSALVNTCNANKASATSALKKQVAPVLAKETTVAETITNANALLEKIKIASNGTTSADANAYTSDLLSVSKTPPTSEDVNTVQGDATVLHGASDNPTGSLSISSGTLVDRLILINKNASAMISKCQPVVYVQPATTTPAQTTI